MNGWSHYKSIALQSVQSATGTTETLQSFPALIACDADAELATARADGGDIRFTRCDGATLLPHWIESWSGGGGSAATMRAWVKVPSIDGTAGATIRVYWGNPSASSAGDPTAPWDEDFLVVCPGGDGASTAKIDNLLGNVEINKRAADQPLEVTGLIDRAQQFGATHYARTANTTTVQSAAWTAEALVRYPSAPSGTYNALSAWHLRSVAATCWGGSRPLLYKGSANYRYWVATAWNTIKDGSWHHVAFINPGGAQADINNAALLVDGAAQAVYSTISSGGVDSTADYNFYLGSAYNTDSSRSIEALVCQFHLSKVARSAAWLKYTALNSLAPPWLQTWGPAIHRGAVLRAAARQCFVAGGEAAAVFAAGAVAAEAFVAGSRAGQVHE